MIPLVLKISPHVDNTPDDEDNTPDDVDNILDDVDNTRDDVYNTKGVQNTPDTSSSMWGSCIEKAHAHHRIKNWISIGDRINGSLHHQLFPCMVGILCWSKDPQSRMPKVQVLKNKP